MGNFSSCCLPKKSEDEINERTHILDNPIASPEGYTDNRYNSCSSVMSPTYGAVNGRTEQNQLNNTLHKLVAKVIDVSSIDNNIEQSDWNERQRIYSQRLAAIRKPLPLKSKHMPNLQSHGMSSLSSPSLTTVPTVPLINRNVTIEPISEDDLNLITHLSQRASIAVRNGFKVQCNESFVVQFDP